MVHSILLGGSCQEQILHSCLTLASLRLTRCRGKTMARGYEDQKDQLEGGLQLIRLESSPRRFPDLQTASLAKRVIISGTRGTPLARTPRRAADGTNLPPLTMTIPPPATTVTASARPSSVPSRRDAPRQGTLPAFR